MTLLERYLNYLSQICEGSRKAPDGITLTKTGDMEKAIELQQQIAAIGASTPLSTGVKTTSCLAIGAAVLALVVACYALSQTGKYADMIAAANINASEAVSISRKADTKAEAAGDRSEKNFVYLRDMKRDLKH